MVVITVPALQKLYSEHDRVLKHFRRYDEVTLMKLLNSVGIEVLKVSYFYASLVLPRSFSKDRSQTIGEWKYSEKHIVTKVIRGILNVDFHVCMLLSRIGISLPGLSLLAVCKL